MKADAISGKSDTKVSGVPEALSLSTNHTQVPSQRAPIIRNLITVDGFIGCLNGCLIMRWQMICTRVHPTAKLQKTIIIANSFFGSLPHGIHM